MARPRAELPPAESVRALLDGEGCLAVRVTPGARKESIELADGKLLVRVHAQPEGGKANEAVMDLVAKALKVAPSRVTLLRGSAAREKLLQIEQ